MILLVKNLKQILIQKMFFHMKFRHSHSCLNFSLIAFFFLCPSVCIALTSQNLCSNNTSATDPIPQMANQLVIGSLNGHLFVSLIINLINGAN